MGLVDYVVNTPQNTNKTILKQLVNSEKNKAVYESVEELKRDGGVGYIDEQPEPMFAEFEVVITNHLARFTEFADATSPFVVVGNRNLVIWDGTPYICETNIYKNLLYVGNATKWLTPGDLMPSDPPIPADNGLPFCLRPIERNGAYGLYVYGEPGTHTLEIQNLAKVIHPVKKEYIPQEVEDNAVAKTLEELGIGEITNFVKDREFWGAATAIYHNRENGWYFQRFTSVRPFVEGETYLLIIDDEEQYFCKCKRANETYLYIGNAAYGYVTANFYDKNIGLNGEDTGEPFCIVDDGNGGYVFDMNNSGNHEFSLCTTIEIKTIKPINQEYMPVADIIEQTIEELSNNGQIGRVAGRKAILTFNGNNEGRPILSVYDLIKISDEAIDLKGIISAVITNRETGQAVDAFEMAASQGANITIESEFGISMIVVDGSVPFVISAPVDLGGMLPIEKGTYVRSDSEMYFSYIETDEYVVPIDKKYLPEDFGAEELPIVTKADAGKVLRVSTDGVWAAETILSAEGVSF